MPIFNQNADVDYYRKNYIASVSFKNGEMCVKDGKRALLQAKSHTDFCYVRDIHNRKEVKLILDGKRWVRT